MVASQCKVSASLLSGTSPPGLSNFVRTSLAEGKETRLRLYHLVVFKIHTNTHPLANEK